MIKLAGLMLIVLSSTMFGLYQSSKLSNRPNEIRRLIRSLQHLETEIQYGFTPMPEALRKIAEQNKPPISNLFHEVSLNLIQSRLSLQEAWHSSIDRWWGNTHMGKNEQEIMMQLGFHLGISDREDQLRHIHLAVSQLKGEELNATEEQNRYGKMWKSLGLLIGAFVAIVFY